MKHWSKPVFTNMTILLKEIGKCKLSSFYSTNVTPSNAVKQVTKRNALALKVIMGKLTTFGTSNLHHSSFLKF